MHAYIIASPSEDERREDVRQLAAALLCQADGKRPCGHCRDCRKSLSGIHPDIITTRRDTDDKGREKRDISVGQVRAIVADAQIMPNEAARKVYVFEDADKMNMAAQNAILKLLEEPPGSAAFVLSVSNPTLLLPTVRSRCALHRKNSDAEIDESARTDAETLLRVIESGNRAKLLRWCTENESLDSRSLDAILRTCRALLADIVRGKGSAKFTPRRCLELDALFSKCTSYLRLNTGVKHVLGLISVDGISENALTNMK